MSAACSTIMPSAENQRYCINFFSLFLFLSLSTKVTTPVRRIVWGGGGMHPICRAGVSRKHHNADADDEAVLMPILEDEIVNGLESSGLTAGHGSPTEERRSIKRKKCSLCLILRVFLVSLLFIFSVSIGLYCLYTHVTMCTSVECTTSSIRLSANMDFDVDPCEDFYQFSCGQWINQSVNLNYPSWNMLYRTTVAAHDRAVKAMLDASEGKFPFPLTRGEQSAVKVFRQCTNGEEMTRIGTKPVIDLIDSLGGWLPDLIPRKPKIVAVFDTPREESPYVLMAEETEEEHLVRQQKELLQRPIEDEFLSAFNLSVFPVFFAGVQTSYFNSSENILTVYNQLPLLMKQHLYYGSIPTVEQVLENAVQDPQQRSVATLLLTVGLEAADIFFKHNSPELRRRIAEMIVLEFKISNCIPAPKELENDLYEQVTIDDLHKIAPSLDWQYLFSKLTGLSLSRMEPIALKHGTEWMNQLAVVLEEYTSTVEKQFILRSYLKWKILMFYITYTKETCETDHTYIWLVGRFLIGPPHLRKEFCVMRLSGLFPLSLPSILRKADGYEKIMESKQMASEVGENVRDAFEGILKETDMFDDYTKGNVLNKLLNMSIKTSFPDKIDLPEELEAEADRVGETLFDSMIIGTTSVYRKSISRLRNPVDSRDWLDTKPAFCSIPLHNYESNMVLVPMDALYAPIGDAAQIDSLNYGAIGSYIGHEITHAFDNEGKQHGPTGNLGHRNWWSKQSKELFLQKEECVVEHYSNFTKAPGISYASRYENIADIVGLDAAYRAWKKNGRDIWQRLPGLSLSPDQRFFVAYAQSWCSLTTEQSPEINYMIEKDRVLGTLRNTPAFSKAFSCKPNSFMNPARQCRIW